MTVQDIAWLLAALAGSCLLAGCLGRRGGDADRDVRAMLAVGTVLATAAGVASVLGT